MDSAYYCIMLEDALLPVVNTFVSEDWILQQDCAPIHVSAHTRNWLEANDISCLGWPSRSPDLNIIENVWGVMAQRMYMDGKTYSNREELQNAVHDSWDSIETSFLQSLYNSIPSRLNAVIASGGAQTKY